MTRDEYLALPDIEKIQALSDVLSESADRSAANALMKGTWVEETFRSVADDLHRVAYRMHFVASFEAKYELLRIKERP